MLCSSLISPHNMFESSEANKRSAGCSTAISLAVDADLAWACHREERHESVRREKSRSVFHQAGFRPARRWETSARAAHRAVAAVCPADCAPGQPAVALAREDGGQ